MTDNLRDVLTRVAERAGPVSVDPLLWSQARRARRRRQRLTAGAAVLVAVAAIGGTVLATNALDESLPPAQRPPQQEQRIAPIDIRGIDGDGGLGFEKDLAIGRASVAIMNDSGAFVMTASDGAYHRLRLPGFDASRYTETAAEEEVGAPEMLSLSPDGTKLAFAWHDSYVVEPDGRAEAGQGWVPSGARVLDLTTGDIDTFPPAGSHEFDYLMTQLGRLTWNFRWSPDSRFVAFDQAVTSTMGWPSGEAWNGLLLDTTERVTMSQEGPGINPRPIDDKRSGPEASAPAAVNNAGEVAWVGTPVVGGRLSSSGPRLMTWTGGDTSLQQLPDDIVWGAGRFSADGETLLIEPAGLDDQVLVCVPGRPAQNRPLSLAGDLPSDRVKVDVQGWLADDEVLALVHEAAGSDEWQADADLAVLTLDLDAGTAKVTVVGHLDAVDSGNVFSLASDLIAARVPPG